MDLYDDAALARPPSLALSLRRLPTELVHKVIDDLPLLQVLQIISHNCDHLRNCVITHTVYRILFEKYWAVTALVGVFVQFREICRFTRSPLVPRGSILGHNATSLRFGVLNNFWDVKKHLSVLPHKLLPQPGTLDMALLETHSTTAFPGVNSPLPIRWKWIKDAKRKLNQKKSQQLNSMADLIAQHPENAMIKKTLDPSQDGPRTNLRHIEQCLRQQAAKARKNRKLLHRYGGRCLDGCENIEFIPYNRYLWYFLETLETHPPRDIDTSIQKTLQDITTLQQNPSTTESTSFQYPPDISKGIGTILEGLMYIYTGSPLVVIPRIDWESISVTGTGWTKPTFYVEKSNHRRNLPHSLHRCAASGIMPHDDREYEWLRAFLKVVSWMENEFQGEGKSKIA